MFSIPLPHLSANFHPLWPKGSPPFWSFSCGFYSPNNLHSRLQPGSFAAAVITPRLENHRRCHCSQDKDPKSALLQHVTSRQPSPILVPACHLAGSPSFPLPGQLYTAPISLLRISDRPLGKPSLVRPRANPHHSLTSPRASLSELLFYKYILLNMVTLLTCQCELALKSYLRKGLND